MAVPLYLTFVVIDTTKIQLFKQITTERGERFVYSEL